MLLLLPLDLRKQEQEKYDIDDDGSPNIPPLTLCLQIATAFDKFSDFVSSWPTTPLTADFSFDPLHWNLLDNKDTRGTLVCIHFEHDHKVNKLGVASLEEDQTWNVVSDFWGLLYSGSPLNEVKSSENMSDYYLDDRKAHYSGVFARHSLGHSHRAPVNLTTN